MAATGTGSNALKLGSCVGEGAFGAVYIGWWRGQRCAVKRFFLRGHDALIRKEIDFIKDLRHGHIIQFLDTDTIDGRLVMITEFAGGGSLQAAILLDDGSMQKTLTWPTKIRIAREMASGLVYMHAKNIIHRDLKSANVLLTKHGEVRLCDFGLARVKITTSIMASNGSKGGNGDDKNNNQNNNNNNKLEGTLRWMAPELLTVKPKYSTKSDMYALGMVMWEMAANCVVPFEDQSSPSIIADHVRAGGREDIPDDIPDKDYARWIERCWKQDPAERPEAEEMVQSDIDDFAADWTSAASGLNNKTPVSLTDSFQQLHLGLSPADLQGQTSPPKSNTSHSGIESGSSTLINSTSGNNNSNSNSNSTSNTPVAPPLHSVLYEFFSNPVIPERRMRTRS